MIKLDGCIGKSEKECIHPLASTLVFGVVVLWVQVSPQEKLPG